MTALPSCDCLTYCGDDPAVRAGRAEPCEAVKRRRREKAERLAIIAKLEAMAASAAEAEAVILNQAAQLIARYPN